MSTTVVRSSSDAPARPKPARDRRDTTSPSRLVYYIADAAFILVLIAPVFLMTLGDTQSAADRPAAVASTEASAP